MATKREVERQKREERAQRYWRDFSKRLLSVRSFREATRLAQDAPPQGAPERRFHSNLGFFLQSFALPDGSTAGERRVYRELIRIFDESGELKPGVRQAVERAIDASPLFP